MKELECMHTERGWQDFVALHHDIDIIDDFTIRLPKISYDRNNWYDDVISKTLTEYQVNTYITDTDILLEKHNEVSIKSYLCY